MARIEKTVFISYRRKDISWALLVYKYLTDKGYDVFFDYKSIPSGDFKQVIIGNIKARAHFLVILTPTALNRCSEPGDWLRREIETAIKEKRNIIPMFFDGFDFGASGISEKLTGKLQNIKEYNGLDVPALYFDEAMDRLRGNFLNVALNTVLHPVSEEVQKAVKEQQVAANEAAIEYAEEIKIDSAKKNKEPENEHMLVKTEKKPTKEIKKDKKSEKIQDKNKTNLKKNGEKKEDFDKKTDEDVARKENLFMQFIKNPLRVVVSLIVVISIGYLLSQIPTDPPPINVLSYGVTNVIPQPTKAPPSTSEPTIPPTNTPTKTNTPMPIMVSVSGTDGHICTKDPNLLGETNNVGLLLPNQKAEVVGKYEKETGEIYLLVKHTIANCWILSNNYVKLEGKISDIPDVIPQSASQISVTTIASNSTKSDADGAVMVFVPEGKFVMGNLWGENPPDSYIDLESFWIDQTEVTNEMFVKFLNDQITDISVVSNEKNQPVLYNGSVILYLQCPKCKEFSYKWNSRISWNEFRGVFEVDSNYLQHPVELVEWYGANEYCLAMGRRLPTEAEWEKAASWDYEEEKKYIYPWGNTEFDCSYANYYANEQCLYSTAAVGSYLKGASPYGVLDMSGNVWEWVSSLYYPYPYNPDDGRENLDTNGGRVVRGGSWAYSNGIYAYARNQVEPGKTIETLAYIGFRCAMDAE